MTRRAGIRGGRCGGLLLPLVLAAAGCGGGSSGGGPILPAPPATPGTPAAFHAAAVAECAGLQRSSGTVHYFCDCQPGAQAGCVPGDDASDGLSPERPRRTWTAAVEAFNAMDAGDTVALCRGGFWNVPGGSTVAEGNCGYAPAAPALANPRCAAGGSLTDPGNTQTCDLRDYGAPWGGTRKPILFAYQAATTNLLNVNSTLSGVRVLNLELRGRNPGPRGGATAADYQIQRGLSFGVCNAGTQASWLVCNVTFRNFMVGIEWAWGSTPRGQVIRGNDFLLNDLDALLGSPGDGGRIEANFFDNNGGFTHPVMGNGAHTIYLAAPTGVESSDVQVVNNELRRSADGATPGGCTTSVLVGHCFFTRLNVENNIVDAGPAATPSCWAVDLRAAGSPPTHYRSATLRRNVVRSAGAGIVLGQAPDSVIENNVITVLGGSSWKVGILSPQDPARPPGTIAGTALGDDVEDRVTIRNNTVYLQGPGATQGVLVGTEGAGHVIANNTVWMTLGTCFDTPLPAGAYAFVGNNACAGGGAWGTGFSATPPLTAEPRYTAPPGDLTPAAGSPLLGAGTAAHAPATDFNLKPRPAPPTIGAYEP